MYSKTPTGKASKGVPVLESFKGRLRIRLRVNGERQGFSLGLPDTPENRTKGEEISRRIQLDLLSGNFDPTFNKYKITTGLTLVSLIAPSKKEQPNLSALWNQYSTAKKRFVSPSTYASDYRAVERAIAKLSTNRFEDASQIKSEILDNHTLKSAKRILDYLKACLSWAVAEGFVDVDNPFNGLTIKSSKRQDENRDINPFTKEERDKIISTFANSRYYSFYTNYVRFSFYTGCRPSEAIGLQWGQIKDGVIEFCQAVVASSDGLVLKTYLKTQKRRKFPLNHEVELILEDVRSTGLPTGATDFVFPSPEGRFIDQCNFSVRIWKKILEEAQVEYRKPYQARHTFITLCVESHINSTAIGRWTGTSAAMIDNHYGATNFTNLRPPTLT